MVRSLPLTAFTFNFVCHVVIDQFQAISFPLLHCRRTTFNTSNSICRYIARLIPKHGLYGGNLLEQVEVDHWLDFADRLADPTEFPRALAALQHNLSLRSYLVGHSLTLADLAVWATLTGNNMWQSAQENGQAPQHVWRWFNFLSSLPHFHAVSSQWGNKIASSHPVGQRSCVKSKEKQEDRAKFVELPGAEMGKVVVRFPPEASGLDHLGGRDWERGKDCRASLW
uniref:Nuclear-export cofactor Arc1-like N-terminal domain-containing protein n=1 Tax=Eptatretus burgeri TaxID=7764 RepID=A0A8C4QFV1_EPTBU